MYCKKCGAYYQDGTPACPNCGTPADWQIVRGRLKPPPPPVDPNKKNNFALIGFILALTSTWTLIVPAVLLYNDHLVTGYLAWAVGFEHGFAGLVLSILGIVKKRYGRKSMAIAGVIISGISAVLPLMFVMMFFSGFILP